MALIFELKREGLDINKLRLSMNNLSQSNNAINFYVNSNPRMLSGKEKILENYNSEKKILFQNIYSSLNSWQKVQIARHPDRPIKPVEYSFSKSKSILGL